MLQVRIDPNNRAGLALVWTAPETDIVTDDYSRGANLLFSIIGDGSNGDNGDRWSKKPAVQPPRRRRRARGLAH